MTDTNDNGLAAYRQRILDCLVALRDEAGQPRLNERQARMLANELSDEELADGMDYNTPEEVADVLLEWNPYK